jgi:hypothetical protein
MLASLGLQAAIYQTITADAELSALVRGVYDSLPQDTEFPYVVIGADTEKPWNSLTEIGREYTVTLHVFSQYPGMRECKQIAGRIIALLGVRLFCV